MQRRVVKTAEAVPFSHPRPATPLKRGVNENGEGGSVFGKGHDQKISAPEKNSNESY